MLRILMGKYILAEKGAYRQLPLVFHFDALITHAFIVNIYTF